MSAIQLLPAPKFEGLVQGKPLSLVTLRNRNGLAAQFSNYGARWLSMWTPDRNGRFGDVVLGFDTMERYIHAKEKYHGAIVGRVCGRIRDATFILGGTKYKLAANENATHHLHGGENGFHHQLWKIETGVNAAGEETVLFSYLSPDKEEAYPGNLSVNVRYTLTHDDAILLEARAETDKTTLVNMTNHAFFNLSGSARPTVLEHELCINADLFAETTEQYIPTGKLVEVEKSPLDFRKSKKIRQAVLSDHPLLFGKNGFSAAFILNSNRSETGPAAELYEPASGRVVRIYTNQPSVQVYSAFYMDGTDRGKFGKKYAASAGIALEPQGFPDAQNSSGLPSAVLEPGQTYLHLTKYKFLSE